MATRKRIDRASSVIMKNIVVISFISSILNTVLLCISASKETWMFGNVSCQIHAIVCYVLLSSIAWLTSLAAIERLYKCLSSGSYSMTFSEINTRILIFGMYMTAFFLCTGPMYGWGEYSQFKGLLMIKVRLLSRHATESTDLCNTTLTNTDAENIQYFGQLITSSLQEKWNMYIRTTNIKCDIHFTVRIRDVTSLTVLLEDVESQQTGNILYDLITHLNNNVTERYTPEIIVDRSNMHNYKNVLLPFQSLGVCTLDFSSVNDYKKSATYYIFGTTLILPFAVTAACGLVVLMNHYSGSLPDNIVNFKIIYFGSLLSFICCFPYYIINFMNGSGHFIPRHANFVSTFFFYNSSLCLTIPYLLYRRPKCRKSTKSTKNSHSYSNSNGIQEDIQVEQEYSKVDYV